MKIKGNEETALDVELDENDANADTVRAYLAVLLTAVLEEEESFSGKRPFGNSGWLREITEPLREAGFNPEEAGFFETLVDGMCGVEAVA